MNRITHLICIFLFVVPLSLDVKGQIYLSPPESIPAVPSLLTAPDARSASIGHSGVASSPDAYSLHWNTAKIGLSQKKFETSISYIPNATNSTNRSHHFYGSGYLKLNEKHSIGGAMRGLSFGNITVFNEMGDPLKTMKVKEFEIVGGYAYRLSKRCALGINLKYISSGISALVQNSTIAEQQNFAIASDFSYYYQNKDLKIKHYNALFSWGINLSNLGNKIVYNDPLSKNFLPANLRLGTSLSVDLADKHALSFSFDLNKLLVPTPPIYDQDGNLIAGKNNTVSSLVGALNSFTDAPGILVLQNGTTVTQKNSRLKEELNEIAIGGGLEYTFNQALTIRAGYFYQHASKGNANYFTCGLGYDYKKLGLDFSYLAPTGSGPTPADRMRFTLRFAT